MSKYPVLLKYTSEDVGGLYKRYRSTTWLNQYLPVFRETIEWKKVIL